MPRRANEVPSSLSKMVIWFSPNPGPYFERDQIAYDGHLKLLILKGSSSSLLLIEKTNALKVQPYPSLDPNKQTKMQGLTLNKKMQQIAVANFSPCLFYIRYHTRMKIEAKTKGFSISVRWPIHLINLGNPLLPRAECPLQKLFSFVIGYKERYIAFLHMVKSAHE